MKTNNQHGVGRQTVRALAILLTLAITLVLAPSALGYETGSLDVDKSQASAGTPVVVEGDGFKGDSDVLLQLFSDPITLGTVRTNAAGSFRTTVVLPAGVTLGAHTITASGPAPDGSTRSLTAPIVITAAAGGENATTATVAGRSVSNPLARTGSSNTIPWAAFGLVLLTVGALTVVVVRRRRAAA